MNSYAYANKLKKQIEQASSSQRGFRKTQLQQSSYINQIPLSAMLDRCPQFFDEIKISVVQKFVNEIDKLPSRYANIETLYLSNNKLTNLQGIQQFKRLKTLTLTNNDLADVSVLRQIQSLSELECLNLVGNPIAKHPNYKIFLLTALQNLKNLDGKVVTEEIRLQCEVKAKQQTQLLALMLRNYGLIIQLNSFSQRFDIHREIAASNAGRFGKSLESQGEYSLQLFKRSFDFLLTLTDREKEELQDLLLNDILDLFLEFQQQYSGNEEDNYERAFQEMLKKQNIKLAELDVLITKKIQAYQQFVQEFRLKFQPQKYGQNNSDFKGSSLAKENQDSQRVPRSPVRNNNNTNTKGNVLASSKSATSLKSAAAGAGRKHQIVKLPDDELDLFSKIGGGNHKNNNNNNNTNNNLNESFNPATSSVGNSNFASPVTRSRLAKTEQKEQDIFLSSSQNSGPFMSNSQPNFFQQASPIRGQQDITINNHNSSAETSPNRTIPQPTSFVRPTKRNNHQDECCNKLMKSARESSQEFRRHEQSTTPYRRRNKELESLLGELTKKMEKKEEEIEQLKIMNNTIKDTLVEVKSSSDQNIQRGISQQQVYLEEIDRNREKSRLLDEEVRELRSELSKVMITNGQIGEAQKQVNYQQQIIKEAEQQLAAFKRERELNELVERFKHKRLLRFGMSMLQISTDMESRVKKFRFDKKIDRNVQLLRNTFSKLRRYCILKRFSRVQQQEQVLSNLVDHFQKWKSNSRFSIKLSKFKSKQEQNRISTAIVAWKQFLSIKAKNNQQTNKINAIRNKQTKLKVWKSLKMNLRDYKLSDKELALAQAKAISFENSKSKRKFMKAWKLFISEYARPMKLKQSAALRLKNLHQLRLTFNSLKKNRKDAVNNIIKANKYIAYEKKKKIRAVFNYLAGPFVQAARENKERNALADLFITKRLLQTWKNTFKMSRNLKKLEEQAKIFSSRQLVLRHFYGIKSLVDMRHRRQLLNRAIQTKREHIVKRQTMIIWFRAYLSHQKTVLERQSKEKQTQLMFFRQWKTFIDAKQSKKKTQRQVLMVLDKKQAQGVSDAFQGWRRLIQRKIRNRAVIENVRSRKELSLKRISLFQLQKELRLGLQKTINNLRNHQQLLVADCKENKAHLDNIDEERGEIAVKSRELMEQNVLMQEKVVELTAEINSLRRQITNNEKMEQSQFERIRELEEKLEEQDAHINEINQEYLVQMGEEEATQKNIRQDNKQLTKEISQLQAELQEKSMEFQEYEKAVELNTRQLVSEKLDIEEKLKQSITMASEFKTKIEQQENELEVFEARAIELEDADTKQREHIQECVQVITTLQTTYDQKVAEYQGIIGQLQSSLEQQQNNEQAQAAQIQQQQQEIATLRYQVSLLIDQQQSSTTNFLQSLMSPSQTQGALGLDGNKGNQGNSNLNHNNSSSQIRIKNYSTYQQKRQSRSQSPEETDFTIRKNQNGSTGSPPSGYEFQQVQGITQPSVTSKDYKILQKQFSRQRTQMKDKIRCLTQQIETTLNAENADEQSKQEFQLDQRLNQSAAVGMQGKKQSYNNNNASTASLFTDRKHGQFFQEKSFDEPSKSMNYGFNQGGKQLIKSSTQQVFGKYSQPSSLRATPKGQQKFYQNNPPVQEGVLRNILTPQYHYPRIAGDNNQMQLLSQMATNSENFQLPTRPESSRETRTHKSSINDLSLINPTDNILNELEKSKSERKHIKSQLESRIKNLNDNLQNDIQNLKRAIPHNG